MKITVLGSSSKGNSTYVEMGDKKFLIDSGFTLGYMQKALHELNVDPFSIDFIIVTHAHIDHVRSLHSLNRIFNIKIYISSLTMNEYNNKDLLKNVVYFDELTNIEGIKFNKIPISHDKKGFGFTFEYDNNSFAYMADTGMIHNRYHELLKNKTVYLLESNHNVEMEMNGNKNEETKIRNIGDEGHLSNEDCAKYLGMFIGPKTKVIELIHISEHDNTYEEAFKVNREAIDKNIKVIYATANEKSETIEI